MNRGPDDRHADKQTDDRHKAGDNSQTSGHTVNQGHSERCTTLCEDIH